MKKSNSMISFQKLWENMEAAKSSSAGESKASSAIRTGIGVREDFWDDFLAVINNSSGLSELLDVPVTKIASWHQKVKEELDKVKEADQTPDSSSNRKMIHTGLPKDKEEDVTNLDQGSS
jgi:hypothetical protein